MPSPDASSLLACTPCLPASLHAARSLLAVFSRRLITPGLHSVSAGLLSIPCLVSASCFLLTSHCFQHVIACTPPLPVCFLHTVSASCFLPIVPSLHNASASLPTHCLVSASCFLPMIHRSRPPPEFAGLFTYCLVFAIFHLIAPSLHNASTGLPILC